MQYMTWSVIVPGIPNIEVAMISAANVAIAIIFAGCSIGEHIDGSNGCSRTCILH